MLIGAAGCRFDDRQNQQPRLGLLLVGLLLKRPDQVEQLLPTGRIGAVGWIEPKHRMHVEADEGLFDQEPGQCLDDLPGEFHLVGRILSDDVEVRAPVEMGKNRLDPLDERLPVLRARRVIDMENHLFGDVGIDHLHAGAHDTTLFPPSRDSALQASLIWSISRFDIHRVSNSVPIER